eukprot:5112706-Heterocapsa_arctica.AAC.1
MRPLIEVGATWTCAAFLSPPRRSTCATIVQCSLARPGMGSCACGQALPLLQPIQQELSQQRGRPA